MDTTHMLPGDIVITRSHTPKLVDPISRVQRLHGASMETSRFTHVAVFVGHLDLLCEARPNAGVVFRPIHVYADGKHSIIVRRPKGFTADERARVVNLAFKQVDKPYAHLYAFSHLFFAAIRSKEIEEFVKNQAFICSTLCQDLLVEARSSPITTDIPRFVMPFHFVTCGLLENAPVPVGWAST